MKLPASLCLLSLLLLTGCKPGLNSADSEALAANLNAPFDYYINGMHTERFNTEGKLAYELSASRVTHFPADDHAELADPVLHWLSDSAEPWIVTANTGNLHHNADKEEVTLTGSVRATSSTPHTGPMLLETSRLNVWPKDKIAFNETEVDFSAQATHWHSKGIRLNLASNTLDLLNDVRGTHVP
jgi:lipopolysaccharide export system protein LptC